MTPKKSLLHYRPQRRTRGGWIVGALVLLLAVPLVFRSTAVSAMAAVVFALIALTAFHGPHRERRRLRSFEKRAIDPNVVERDGPYTKPRTWGVYEVPLPRPTGDRGFVYYSGNHPVRQYELQREHGAAELVLLFPSKTDADDLKLLLNKR